MEFLHITPPEVATRRLQDELTRFGKEKSLSVKLSQVSWDEIWRELLNTAIYRRSADVAEIGSTWLESLVAMDALNPFSARDIYELGSKHVFFPAAWQNVVSTNSEKDIYGIPFRADARVIFYWKDMFEKASVDASQAFLSHDSMVDAFTRLQEMGMAGWAASTNDTNNTVYAMASWVWGAGGDFIAEDGKRTKLNSAEGRRGAYDYFDLMRFMPQHNTPITDTSVLDLFFERKAASTVAGPWLLNSLRIKKASEIETLLPLLGTAQLPGPSFIGGTLLVSWKHGLHPVESVELISRLTSPEFQADYCGISGLLPVRQNLWSDEFLHSHEHLPTFNQALQNGHGMPPIALWGMIEGRLTKTMAAIWQEMYAQNKPGQAIDDLDEIITKHFEVFAARLDTTLAQND